MKKMSDREYQKRKEIAEKFNKKIDDFLTKIYTEDDYGWAAKVFKRMLKVMNDDDIEDILFELDLEHNIKSFKIENLTQEMRLEDFLADIKENPCQLKLIA